MTSPAIHADHRGRNGSGRHEDSEHAAAAVGLDEAAELGVDAHRLPRPAPTARRAPDLFHQGSHAGERRQQLFSLSLKPRRVVAEEGVLGGDFAQATDLGAEPLVLLGPFGQQLFKVPQRGRMALNDDRR